MPRYTFGKSERLCSKKAIEQLFAPGNRTLSAFPLRAVYMPAVHASASNGAPISEKRAPFSPCRVLLSVSKRRQRHAVDRNRLKRLMREAYRRHKHLLCDAVPEGQTLNLALLWVSNELASYTVVEQKMRNLLLRIREELSAPCHETPAQ